MHIAKLKKLRSAIDALDKRILRTLAERMDIVRDIGKLKKENGLSLFDDERMREVLTSRIAFAKKLGLPAKLVDDLYKSIHKYSLKIERTEV